MKKLFRNAQSLAKLKPPLTYKVPLPLFYPAWPPLVESASADFCGAWPCVHDISSSRYKHRHHLIELSSGMQHE